MLMENEEERKSESEEERSEGERKSESEGEVGEIPQPYNCEAHYCHSPF